jgi:hypothetical protein
VQLDHVDDARESGFGVVTLDMGLQQQSQRISFSELNSFVFYGHESEDVFQHDRGVPAGQVVVEVQRCDPVGDVSRSLRGDAGSPPRVCRMGHLGVNTNWPRCS